MIDRQSFPSGNQCSLLAILRAGAHPAINDGYALVLMESQGGFRNCVCITYEADNTAIGFCHSLGLVLERPVVKR